MTVETNPVTENEALEEGTPESNESVEEVTTQTEESNESEEDAPSISAEEAAEKIAKERKIQGYHKRKAHEEVKQTVEEQVAKVLYKKEKSKLLSSVEDEATRALIEDHLENTIKASGDAERDFQNARNLVDAEILRIQNREKSRIASQAPKVTASQSTATAVQPKITTPEQRQVEAEVAALKQRINMV